MKIDISQLEINAIDIAKGMLECIVEETNDDDVIFKTKPIINKLEAIYFKYITENAKIK